MAKLQAMFKEAMQSKAAGDKKVRLTLDKDTTYDGDVEFSSDQYDVDDDFEVELVAGDAGEDNLQSEGTTVIAGNITIKGINLKILGLSIKAGNKVSVEAAKLTYTGTRIADTVNVELGKGASADIQTGAGGDTVTATLTDDASLTVDSGDDDDTVTVTSEATGALKVDTGDGNDTVEATITKTAAATLETGAVVQVPMYVEIGDVLQIDTRDGRFVKRV